MAKKYYSFTNMVLTSLIALLGFGSCKTTKKVENEPTPKESEFQLDADSVERAIPRPRNEIRVLYGVPPTRMTPLKRE